MKNIYNYRVYLLISLMSLFIACLLNVFLGDIGSEVFALVAFIFFTIAVVMVALEEFFSLRPNVKKNIKAIFHIWRK